MLKAPDINEYSIYGDSFKTGRKAWVIEQTHYSSSGRGTSVRSSIWQTTGVEPALFRTKEEAEAAVPRMLNEGDALKLIGYSIKQITLVEIK